MNKLRVWPSGPTTKAASPASKVPAYMRSPGFFALGVLSLPTLLLLVASSWQSSGRVASLIAAVVGIAAIGTCVFAAMPLGVASTEER